MTGIILSLGLNDEVVGGVARPTNNPRFAHDSYRRFIRMFADVIMGLNKAKFENIVDEMREKKGIEQDTGLDTDDMKEMVKRFKKLYKDPLEKDFPSGPKE